VPDYPTRTERALVGLVGAAAAVGAGPTARRDHSGGSGQTHDDAMSIVKRFAREALD
jgi:hypothetical protein